jgi:hypothetical protein
VRCGAVRCGAVRCGAVRCGAVRCGAVRCGAVRRGAARRGAARLACCERLLRDETDSAADNALCARCPSKLPPLRYPGPAAPTHLLPTPLHRPAARPSAGRRQWPQPWRGSRPAPASCFWTSSHLPPPRTMSSSKQSTGCVSVCLRSLRLLRARAQALLSPQTSWAVTPASAPRPAVAV